MGDADDLFAKELLQLRGLAKFLYRKYKAAFGWSEFDSDDLLSKTWIRILEITEPRGTDGTRVKIKDGEPVDQSFYSGVMYLVALEMIKESRLNRLVVHGDSDSIEELMETLEDQKPLQDKDYEVEELRRLVLDNMQKIRHDDCFKEIMRKILYEGYTPSKAIAETRKEMDSNKVHSRSTYFRWFSKIRDVIDALYTKNRKGEDEADGRKR